MLQDIGVLSSYTKDMNMLFRFQMSFRYMNRVGIYRKEWAFLKQPGTIMYFMQLPLNLFLRIFMII